MNSSSANFRAPVSPSTGGSFISPAQAGGDPAPVPTRAHSEFIGENAGAGDNFKGAHWHLSHRADARALPLADRHYNRQKPGSPQFLPPGRCFALITAEADALWATSFPFAQYVKHAWAGAWMNSLFRNENRLNLSSNLIREAVAMTRWYHATNPKWSCEPEPPLGMVTFVDADKTNPKRDPGRCYRRAGFKHVGFTKAGLWVLQMLPSDMPEPMEIPS